MTDATLPAAAIDPAAAARRRRIVTLVVHVAADRRVDRDALPAALDAVGVGAARGGDLHLALDLAVARSASTPTAAAGTALQVSFGTFFWNSFVIAGLARHRQRHRLLARGLRLRAAEVPRPQLLVRDHARHADDPLPRHADPAVRAVPQPRLGRHHPAAGGAEVPRGRRLLHLPDGAVLPRHPARARRGGDDGRLLALAHLLEDHAAALDCRCWRPRRSSPSSGPGTTSSGR